MEEYKKQPYISLVARPEKYKLIISENLEDKIRYACAKLPDKEWSGALFYSHTGNFEDGSLVIKCEDLYIMDVGSAVYTEFTESSEIIGYMAENPELLDCQIGLIHSHDTMPTFFSGTDTNTLKEEGKDKNHFVSLIVNNEGKYTAAITRQSQIKETVKRFYNYPTFGGDSVSGNNEYDEVKDVIEYFFLDIENQKINKYNEIVDRINTIQKAKTKAVTTAKTVANSASTYSNFGSYNYPSNTSWYKKEKDIAPFSENDYKTETKVDTQASLFYDDEDYEKYSFDPDIIKSIVLQLITGSVLCSNKSKIVPTEWATKMVPLFKNRFVDKTDFDSWAENYIDFLCNEYTDEDLEKAGLDPTTISAVCANDTIKALKTLPSNKYIVRFIEILTNYLL